MADTLTPERVERDLADEHQGRKLDHFFPFPLDHMNDHRHRQRGEPDQKQRRKKGHQRTRLSFCRMTRNLNSAWSSGVRVSNNA